MTTSGYRIDLLHDPENLKRYLLTDTFFIESRKVVVKTSLFVVLLFVGLLPASLLADDCSLSPHQLETSRLVNVDKTIDGDTVRLSNGKLVRFIGINTPEIDHRFGRSEPFAERARDYLSSKIKRFNGKLRLLQDTDTEDRHGRMLAHIFTPTGQNIQADTLLNGYGTWIVVPPNLKFMDCYRRMEGQARQENRGIWNRQFRAPRQTRTLTEKDRGFQWIQGKISRVSRGKKFWWLNFEDQRSAGKFSKVSLRVHKDDLHYFSKQKFEQLQGKIVRVKGWLTQQRKQLVMALKHPASMEVVEQ